MNKLLIGLIILHLMAIKLYSIDYQMDTSSVFKIISRPIPQIVDAQINVCAGSRVTYQCNIENNTNYKWSVTGGLIYGLSNQYIVIVDWGSNPAGSLKLVQTKSPSGCKDSITLDIIIIPYPKPIITEGESSVCANNQYTYLSNLSSGLNNRWIVTGGTIIGQNNGANVKVLWSNEANGTIKLIQSSAWADCKDSVDLNIKINPLPEPEIIDATTSVCAGNQYTYSSNPASGISNKWIISEGTINGSSLGVDVAVTWGGSGLGKVKLIQTKNSTGCKDSNEIDIIINPKPLPQLVKGELNVCSGIQQNYECNIVSGLSAIWVAEGGKIISSSLGKNIDVIWENSPKGYLRLIQTHSQTGCKDSIIIEVNVRKSPDNPVVSDTNIAYEGTAVLSPQGNSTYSYYWYNSQVAENPFSIESVLILDKLVKDTTVYVASYDINADCYSGKRIPVTVTVAKQGAFVMDMISRNETICEGDSVFIGLKNEINIGTQPILYNWNPAKNVSNPNSHATWVKPTSTTEFTLSVKDNDNREGSAKVLVSVNKLPSVKFNFDDKEFCLNDDEIVLTGGTPEGGTYFGTAVEDNKFSPIKAGIGSHIISYTYSDSNACAKSASITFKVFVHPEKPAITESKKKLSTAKATSYQWFFNDTIIENANAQTYEPSLTGIYNVEVGNSHGCQSMSDDYFFDITSVDDYEHLDKVKITPNPFSNTTYISWEMMKPSIVQISVSDILGQEKVRLVDNIYYEKGLHKVEFMPINLSSGVYFLNLKTLGINYNSKIVILK